MSAIDTATPASVVYDMPEAEYRALPAAGSGDIKAILRSPAHYRAGLDAESESTDAQLLGTAAHLAVLEPERFERHAVAAPRFDKRTTAGKAAAAEFDAAHAGRLVLPSDMYDTARRVRDAVRSHPAAMLLLAEGASEVSLQWTDEATGTPCKARLDRLLPDHSVVDLKTARDASPAGFGRAVAQYRYAVQQAHYQNGVRAVLGADCPLFAFIAVETAPPYAVGVYVIDDESVTAAEARVAEALRRHRTCRESGSWPAYSDLIETISVPKWAQ